MYTPTAHTSHDRAQPRQLLALLDGRQPPEFDAPERRLQVQLDGLLARRQRLAGIYEGVRAQLGFDRQLLRLLLRRQQQRLAYVYLDLAAERRRRRRRHGARLELHVAVDGDVDVGVGGVHFRRLRKLLQLLQALI